MTDATPTRDYLDRLFADNRLVELRHQVGRRWQSGLFDDPDALLAAARRLAGTGNLFTSLNPISPRTVRNRMGSDPITNGDVVRYARLFFDFDPVRPTDTASTDEELCNALASADGAERIFTACGFPAPARAVSGNGAHLLYRTALPNDDMTRELLRTVYTGLKRDFDTDLVKFDPAVRNPGRIGPLYGSIKRKGQPTADRPHRQSQIWLPEPWKQVSPRTLEALAGFYRRQAPATSPTTHAPSALGWRGAGDYRSLDVVTWFAAHQLYHQPAGDPGKHFVRCPWEAEHSDGFDAQLTDTVVWEADGGWPTFHCSHAHCADRGIGEVIALYGDADRYCTRSWRSA